MNEQVRRIREELEVLDIKITEIQFQMKNIGCALNLLISKIIDEGAENDIDIAIKAGKMKEKLPDLIKE